MSESFDPLEAELRALSPQELSPELKERIADRLAPAVVNRPAGRWSALQITQGLVAAGLVAACLAAVIFFWRGNNRNIAVKPSRESLAPPLTIAFDETLPSLWQYRSALNRSVNELDALLDKHGGTTLDSQSQVHPIRGFGRFDTTVNTFPGEL